MPMALRARPPVTGEVVDDVPAGTRRMHAGRDGVYSVGRDLTRYKRAGAYGAAGIAGLAATRQIGRRRFAEHPERKPSFGRMAAGTALGPYHAAVAGKPGQKLKALAPYVPLTVGTSAAAYQLQKPHMAAMRESAAGISTATSEREVMGAVRAAGGHWRAGLKASLPVTAASYLGQAAVTRHNASKGRYKEQTMAKADHSGPSTSRYVAGAMFGGAHGLVAGKKGRKLGAGAVEAIPNVAAGALVATAGARVAPVAAAVKYGGRLKAVQLNQRAGNLKPEPVTTAKSMTCLPTETRYLVQRTPDGRYAGDGNALTHVQVTTRHRTSGSAPTVATPASGRSGGRAPVSRVSPSRLPAPGQGSRGRRIR